MLPVRTALVSFAIFTAPAAAGVVTADLNGLEINYGGPAGIGSAASPFDLGFTFPNLDTAVIRLTVIVPETTAVQLTPTTDGVTDPQTIYFLSEGENRFVDIALSRAAIAQILDGTGSITLNLSSPVFSSGGQVRVTRAVLIVDEVVPAPGAAATLALAGLVGRRRRR